MLLARHVQAASGDVAGGRGSYLCRAARRLFQGLVHGGPGRWPPRPPRRRKQPARRAAARTRTSPWRDARAPRPRPASSGSTCANIRAAAAADGRADGSRRSSAAISGASWPACGATGASSLMMADIVVIAPPRCSYGPRPFDRRVDRGAERPQVGRGRGVAAADPLGRGEPGGAHHHPGLRQPRVALELRDAEVGQHRPLVPARPRTLPSRSARCSASRPGAAPRRRARRRARTAAAGRSAPARGGGSRPSHGQHLVERPRRDELHDDPRAAVFLGDVVDGDHAAVRQPRGGPRLAQRPLVGVAAARPRRSEAEMHDLLDRHVTVEELVARTPHHAHGATADGVLQVVPPGDDPSCHRGHSRTISAFRGGCRLRAADPPPRRRSRCPCRRR